MSVKNKLVVESYEKGIDILEKKYKDAYEITDVTTKRKWVVAGPKRCQITYINEEKAVVREVEVAPLKINESESKERELTQAEKDLMDEVATMRDMMQSLMDDVGLVMEKSKKNGNGVITGLEDALINNGVLPEIAENLVKKAVNSLHPKNRENKNHLLMAMKKVLVDLMNVRPGYDVDECSVIAFVGPTGVGKTTTLAKTATIFQESGKKVALITLDTYKLGAVDQIEEYGNLLSVPVDACSSPDELLTSMFRFVDKDCLFVDTMGHNPKDVKSNTLLKKMLDEVNPTHLTLVMSANMKTKDMFDCVEQFKHLDLTSIIMTKLDETNSLGEIINVAYTYPKLKMVYFTTGQSVPEDIEVPKAENIIKAVISES